MRHKIHFACGVALLTAWLAVQAPALATDYRAGALVVTQPWSRPSPPAATVGVVYFSIANTGRKGDSLIGISSPIAAKAEIHETRRDRGVVEMRPLTSVECAPGVSVKSEPGGLHVMLIGLTGPLQPGTEFPLSLHFRDAGVLNVKVIVEARE